MDETTIYEYRTKFQEVLITEGVNGRSLYLEGDLQFDDDNEACYHEQVVNNLDNYSSVTGTDVCIIGGGDGGCIRNLLLKNPNSITLVDMDKEILEISTKFFPKLNDSGKVFTNEKVTVFYQDAIDYFKGDVWSDSVIFDVTVSETTDSLSFDLFSTDFINNLKSKTNCITFFISYISIHKFDLNILNLFSDFKAHKMQVPRYERDGIIGIVAKF